MRLFLEWRIKWLQGRVKRLQRRELEIEETARLDAILNIVGRRVRAEQKLKDLQAEHDLWYGNKYRIHIVRHEDRTDIALKRDEDA